MKNNVALIPARSGSKGIKNKNLKIFNKKPLVCWAIKNSVQSKIINRASAFAKKYSTFIAFFASVIAALVILPKTTNFYQCDLGQFSNTKNHQEYHFLY